MRIDDAQLYLSQQQTTREPANALGKDHFLQLLMAQLRNQDPLDPMDDKEFVAQMATFSQLEQSINMAETLERLTVQQTQSNFLQFAHLIDKDVTYATYDSNGQYMGTEVGTVQSVSSFDNEIFIKLTNGEEIHASYVTEVGQGADEVIDDDES